LTEERACEFDFPARHLAFESAELLRLASDGFRYFKRCPSVALSSRVSGRGHEEEKDREIQRERERGRGRVRKLFQSASLSRFDRADVGNVGYPVTIRQ